MANETVAAAQRGLKAVGAEITQWENRLEYVKGEVDRLNKTKASIEAEIAQKSADYDVYIAKRDSDSKRLREDVTAEKAKLEAAKKEFQSIVADFQKEKELHLEDKQSLALQKTKSDADKDNVRQFVIAVQRASSLLGI